MAQTQPVDLLSQRRSCLDASVPPSVVIGDRSAW